MQYKPVPQNGFSAFGPLVQNDAVEADVVGPPIRWPRAGQGICSNNGPDAITDEMTGSLNGLINSWVDNEAQNP